jgi:hypothetical protein
MMRLRVCVVAERKQEVDVMDFAAVVDQVLTLLRQRGRLTYRTIMDYWRWPTTEEARHDQSIW